MKYCLKGQLNPKTTDQPINVRNQNEGDSIYSHVTDLENFVLNMWLDLENFILNMRLDI